MKLTSLLATVLLCGCHSISIPTPFGLATVRSFGQKTSISELSMGTNGVLVVRGYNNDQIQAIAAATAAAVQAAMQGMKP